MAGACAALRAADMALAGGHTCEGAAPADESAPGEAVCGWFCAGAPPQPRLPRRGGGRLRPATSRLSRAWVEVSLR